MSASNAFGAKIEGKPLAPVYGARAVGAPIRWKHVCAYCRTNPVKSLCVNCGAPQDDFTPRDESQQFVSYRFLGD